MDHKQHAKKSDSSFFFSLISNELLNSIFQSNNFSFSFARCSITIFIAAKGSTARLHKLEYMAFMQKNKRKERSASREEATTTTQKSEASDKKMRHLNLIAKFVNKTTQSLMSSLLVWIKTSQRKKNKQRNGGREGESES
jgi:hypothetical protein